MAARLGHRFRDPALLVRAMTHPSAATGARDTHYERLEFLGDRVLGLVVADMLLPRFPAEAEGLIALRHAAVVRREALAEVAQSIGLGEMLQIAKGEEEAGERQRRGREGRGGLSEKLHGRAPGWGTNEGRMASLVRPESVPGGPHAFRSFLRPRPMTLRLMPSQPPPRVLVF